VPARRSALRHAGVAISILGLIRNKGLPRLPIAVRMARNDILVKRSFFFHAIIVRGGNAEDILADIFGVLAQEHRAVDLGFGI
jgi:hypothetical protein